MPYIRGEVERGIHKEHMASVGREGEEEANIPMIMFYDAEKTKELMDFLRGDERVRFRISQLDDPPLQTKIEYMHSLLRAKADPDGDYDGPMIGKVSPLKFAIEYRNLPFCKDLVNLYHADPKRDLPIYEETPLHWVVVNATTRIKDNKTSEYYDENINDLSQFDEEILNFLIEKGADLNVQTRLAGKTALHYACERRSGNVEVTALHMIKTLLRLGADPNAVDAYDETPLFGVIHRLDQGVATRAIELLKFHGADVNHKDEDGNTSLHFSMTHCMTEHTIALLANGARILYNNGEDNSGTDFEDVAPKTPIDMLADDCENLIPFLRELNQWLAQNRFTLMDFGADDANAKDCIGFNLIAHAICNLDDDQFAMMLPKYLAQGCALNIKYTVFDDIDTTLLHAAMCRCHLKSAIMLVEEGAFMERDGRGKLPIDLIPVEENRGLVFRAHFLAWARSHATKNLAWRVRFFDAVGF